jgi:hypothetical protein
MHHEKTRNTAARAGARAEAGAGASRTRRSRGKARRRRGRRTSYALGALVAAGVAGAVLAAAHDGPAGGGSRDAARLPASEPTVVPPSRLPAEPQTEPSSEPPSAGPSRLPSSAPSAGDGGFDTAQASGTTVGRGTVRRYKVQVERGTGVSATDAAHEIAGILGDRRSWIADGHDAFRLVSGGPYDFEVKIASPATVDRICGAAGLHTHGEVNCDVGDQVVVNLKRWKNGSPQFPGPLHEYRALIINHEVGHRIGHGHEGCPGPGRPAPAMMQQIDGLHGCVANAWPYDAHGTYLSGPPMP